MIRNWRRDWGQGDFPFLAVQLAPWDRNRNRTPGTDHRRARRQRLGRTARGPGASPPRCSRTSGWPSSPTWATRTTSTRPGRRPVGERLALLAARHRLRRERSPGAARCTRASRSSGDKAIVDLRPRRQRARSREGGKLTGFAIAGADRKFVWADAQIGGKDKVMVSSPAVPKPVAVRYGWADYPVVNLFSKTACPRRRSARTTSR